MFNIYLMVEKNLSPILNWPRSTLNGLRAQLLNIAVFGIKLISHKLGIENFLEERKPT